jgi:hypothetical protein
MSSHLRTHHPRHFDFVQLLKGQLQDPDCATYEDLSVLPGYPERAELLNQLLAEFLAVTGTSWRIVEHPLLRFIIRLLVSPTLWSPPDRKTLSTKYLDLCYNATKTNVREHARPRARECM